MWNQCHEDRESPWTPGQSLIQMCVWYKGETEEKLGEGIGREGKPTEDCDSALEAHVKTKVS